MRNDTIKMGTASRQTRINGNFLHSKFMSFGNKIHTLLFISRIICSSYFNLFILGCSFCCCECEAERDMDWKTNNILLWLCLPVWISLVSPIHQTSMGMRIWYGFRRKAMLWKMFIPKILFGHLFFLRLFWDSFFV